MVVGIGLLGIEAMSGWGTRNPRANSAARLMAQLKASRVHDVDSDEEDEVPDAPRTRPAPPKVVEVLDDDEDEEVDAGHGSHSIFGNMLGGESSEKPASSPSTPHVDAVTAPPLDSTSSTTSTPSTPSKRSKRDPMQRSATTTPSSRRKSGRTPSDGHGRDKDGKKMLGDDERSHSPLSGPDLQTHPSPSILPSTGQL